MRSASKSIHPLCALRISHLSATYLVLTPLSFCIGGHSCCCLCYPSHSDPTHQTKHYLTHQTGHHPAPRPNVTVMPTRLDVTLPNIMLPTNPKSPYPSCPPCPILLFPSRDLCSMSQSTRTLGMLQERSTGQRIEGDLRR
ncbi:hypothetical protein BC835DRAFT_1341337 [Cytidiella melzeri]|nr:hypothetical protein BC835DRAFT_1341337 [Cytidiella melzeri]